MKSSRRKNEKEHDPDMLPEYDFSGGVVGKYAARYAKGTNVVVLEPDVALAFPNSEAVNRALRQLMDQQESNNGEASTGSA
jgi:hypothetical protein